MRPALAFLLGFVVLFPATLRRDLWSPDEPRHAEVARSMLDEGTWLVPHLEGRPYPDKPAPPFWITAASMALFGRSEWAARLPYVLASCGTLAALAALCRLLAWPAAASSAAVLVLLTSYRFLWLSQRVSLDALMTFFTTLAVLAWLRHVRGRGGAMGNGLLFFGASAAAVLTKGPLGLLVPLATAVAHGAATRNLRRLADRRFLLGVALFALLVAGWVVPACLAGGRDYAHELLFKQSAGRVLHAWNHQRPFHYYLLKLPLEFLPWSPVLLFGLYLAARRRWSGDRASLRLALAWFLPVFVFLSFVQSKRGNYLLPLYPALAILTAATLAQGAAVLGIRRSLAVSCAVPAIAGLALAAAPFVPRLAELGVGDFRLPGLLIGGGLALASLRLALAALREDPLATARRLGLALAVANPSIGLFVLPAVDAAKSPRPLAEVLVSHAAKRAEYVPFLDVRTEEYRFYSGLDCREVDGRRSFLRAAADPRVRLAVVDAKQYRRIARRLPRPARVLAERLVGGEDRVLVLELLAADEGSGEGRGA